MSTTHLKEKTTSPMKAMKTKKNKKKDLNPEEVREEAVGEEEVVEIREAVTTTRRTGT